MKRFWRKFSPKEISALDKGKPIRGAESSGLKDGPNNDIQNGRLGLFRLGSELDAGTGDTTSGLDIVAIHGLNGDFGSTWTHSNGTFWLRDLLPQAMPGCRVFSYGYPSQIAFSRSVASIRDYALSLLNWIEQEQGHPPRSIVFVCHSLGGIVAKQAIIVASELEEFKEISSQIKGIVFMGTPHRGSSAAGYGKIIGEIANLALHVSGSYHLTGGVNTSLLRDLHPASSQLLAIAHSFLPRAKSLEIVSFYETETHPVTKRLVVEQSSAVLGLWNERCKPLYLNHQDLCRFFGPDDPNYKQVLHSLRKVFQTTQERVDAPSSSLNTDRSYDEDEKACMSLLNSVDVAGYESRLDRRVDGTLEWLIATSQYITWKSSRDPTVLWVSGYAGCGKTILASYMVHHLTAESPRSVVCRFFCDGNIDGQRDATSLLQSLIFQIIDRRRRLVRLVRRASNSGGLQVLRQVDSLWALFVRLIRTAKIGEVDIIIDAIDECDDKTQSLFARRIAELIKLDSSTLIKFIITSRPNTPAAFALDAESSRLVKLSLEENQDIIGRDVNMVIHHRLEMLVRRGGCIPSAREYLERTLVSKADRTFLWITLVLQLLEQRRVLSTKKDVMKIVDHLPPDLSSVYQHLLLSIPEDDRALASRILRTVLASSRPLTVEEIGIILSLEPGTEPTSPDAEASLSIDDRNVQAALGPLIRVSQSKVELVHQSPKEYLIHLNSDSKNPLAAVFGFDIQRDTQSLVSACWRYLSLDEFQDDIFAAYDFEESTVPVTSPVSSATSQSSFNLYDEPMFKDRSILESDACGRIAARHKLFDYAAMYWALDFSRCESVSSPAQQRTAQGLCAKDQWRTSNWFRYFWLNSYRDPYPAAVDPLLIMAFLGLANSLRDLLHNSEANNNQSVSYAVYWAAREGHDGCIRVLLERPEVDPSASVVNNQTSLSAAAEHGHTLCVLLLLQDGRFDINAANSHGRTPLSLAAGNGHNDIVRALLLREDLSANQPDNSGATPLFWAIYTGSVSVMSQLLTNRLVHNNQRDKHGRNALSWAAQDGLEEVVELLLRFPEVEKGQKDFSGRNPLSYAAQHGHYGVAQLLVSGDIPSISECDNNGRNAISWAASQNKTDVLDFLLKTDHTAANMGDKSGWTPLFWALDPPGYPGNVSVFLASASVDINSRDRGHNRTVLSWASSYGDVETVSLLISVDGVDLEAKDDGGRTAFSYAAGCGSVKVATLLAEAGADILSKDHLGRTALWWAVSGGYLDTAQYVVSLSSALVTMIDVRTRTPLDLARQYQRHDIEALLLRQESLITR